VKTLCIRNARRPGHDAALRFRVSIDTGSGLITAVEPDTGAPSGADTEVDARGAMLLAGAIDCHVHFREPGLTHKATIATESRAAIAGGVTSYIEMPNTKPPTVTVEAWQQKMDIAARDSMANYAFFIGATDTNLDTLRRADYSRVPGVKLFMGSSTGNMLVDSDSALRALFQGLPEGVRIAIHAEDQATIDEANARLNPGGDAPVALHSEIRPVEACTRSTAKALALAEEYRRPVTICHVTTADELAMVAACPQATAEVSPHHLMWCSDDYSRKGSRIKMNPSVKDASHCSALRQALLSGEGIGFLATDHAPHEAAAKATGTVADASGAPVVQFALPWLLTHFPADRVEEYYCRRPAEAMGIEGRGRIAPGCHADIVLAEECDWTVADSDALSLCGWTPLAGERLGWRITRVWVNGHEAYARGAFSPASAAQPLRFNKKH